MDGRFFSGHGWPEKKPASRPTSQARAQSRARPWMADAGLVRGDYRTTPVRTTGARRRLRHGWRKKAGEAWMPNAVGDDARATPTPRNPASRWSGFDSDFLFDTESPSSCRPRCFRVHSRVTVPSAWMRSTPVSKGFSLYGVGLPPPCDRRIPCPLPHLLFRVDPIF